MYCSVRVAMMYPHLCSPYLIGQVQNAEFSGFRKYIITTAHELQ